MSAELKESGAIVGRVSDFEPCYLRLHRSGELAERAREAHEHLKDCDLCARCCRVNRLETVHGAACRTGERAVVNSFARFSRSWFAEP